MKREATLSPCGSYRYDMTRSVEAGCSCKRCAEFYTFERAIKPGFVLWVLCNPSIADAEIDDPTERRCWGFTSSWGYSKMVMVNVNPHRSTDPKLQRVPGALIQLHNQGFLLAHPINASLIVCAWGNNAHEKTAFFAQSSLMTTVPEKLHHLGLTKLGQPKHPLYLPKDTKPQLWII